MANLRTIKDRISSIKNTKKITNAMKMVAAAKVKKAENAVRASRPYTRALYNMFTSAYKEYKKSCIGESKHKNAIENYVSLLNQREVKTVGLVILSSNKGLAGAYCANVVRFALDKIKKYNQQNIEVKLYVIGAKAVPALKSAKSKYKFEIEKTYVNILDGINASSAYIVASHLADDYVSSKIDKIDLITTRYKNMMSYKTESWQLLPAIIEEEGEIKRFQNKELDKELNIEHDNHECKINPISEFIPNLESILVKIVPTYMTNILYQALLEAQASELASRMTAMSSATNNANDMIVNLTIEYNKARQAKITQELTEVISGANAQKN